MSPLPNPRLSRLSLPLLRRSLHDTSWDGSECLGRGTERRSRSRRDPKGDGLFPKSDTLTSTFRTLASATDVSVDSCASAMRGWGTRGGQSTVLEVRRHRGRTHGTRSCQASWQRAPQSRAYPSLLTVGLAWAGHPRARFRSRHSGVAERRRSRARSGSPGVWCPSRSGAVPHLTSRWSEGPLQSASSERMQTRFAASRPWAVSSSRIARSSGPISSSGRVRKPRWR